MRNFKIALWGLLISIAVLTFLGYEKNKSVLLGKAGGGGKNAAGQAGAPFICRSYTDIPGVTAEEKAAIERFRGQGRIFTYGMISSSECFQGEQAIEGYAALYCNWLTELFGIPFVPAIYDWNDLINGLESGTIDFTGELNTKGNGAAGFYMTGPIAERFLTIIQKTGSQDVQILAKKEKPQIAFLKDSAAYNLVRSQTDFEFTPLYFETVNSACLALLEGKADAFIDASMDGITNIYNELTEETFLPYIYTPVSMAARDPELKPFISVVQKYLDQGGERYLLHLYNQGSKDFQHFRFIQSLTEEERLHLAFLMNKPIPIRAEWDNYPIAFYNSNESQWQGIAWDILREIETISGLSFEATGHPGTVWSESLAALEQGSELMISELIPTPEREGRFLWGDVYQRDNYALLAKADHDDVAINEIIYSRVGLVKGTAHTDVFKRWFPNHPNTTEYEAVSDALDSLKKGEVDMVMGTKNMLLTFTNYREDPGYKLIWIFNQTVNSSFGFNLREKTLCAIINKAQALVDTGSITSRWTSKVFDYRTQMMRFRQPYLIAFSLLLGLGVFLLIALVQKYKVSGQELEVTVKRRTQELEERGAELEQRRNAAQRAYKVKNRFLANMSHEILTPLNAIIGLSQTELDKAEKDSQENLSAINRSGMALLSVINDLLDISNIESGEMELTVADYSLPALISGAITAVKMWIGGKPIQFRLEMDENLPMTIRGDKQRVKQILNNLLNNAVKYTQQGSVILRVGFSQSASAQEAGIIDLIFEIHDTGMGIKPGHMEKLFTDYGQADTKTTRSTSGIGMGLLITKKLAELMEGEVEAISEFGRGSVFSAKLRQIVTDPFPVGKDTVEKLKAFTWKEEQEDRLCLPYARVLVVDDVPTNHAVARGIMRPYRMTVDAVSSGQEAVDLIARGEPRYDAIFMDHMMPEMDGMEAAALIRAQGTEYASTVPIIALTANALPENEKLFLKNGFNAFMAKPININKLNKVLMEWVRDEKKEALYTGAPQEEEEQPETNRLLDYAIDGVDLAAGAAQFGGEESYLEIVKVFVSDTPKLLRNIQQNLDGFRIMPAAAAAALSALKNYTIAVHGIKGSCYGICATPVGDLAKELELAAKAQDMGKVLELNNRFIQAAEKLVEELQALFPQKEENPKLQRTAPDTAALRKLLDAVRAYNINDILEILKELEQYGYQENGDLVVKLREAANEYEYGTLRELLTGALSPEDDKQELLFGTAG
ncbi:MAG: transporter substrate-binding domain-containing protein [Treponema sp.]|jgi:signal transduction histidine kinase/CheY-like chemotaxis protein|nr:transporter substrate-binding domain-containing protein [Treponema sp.]